MSCRSSSGDAAFERPGHDAAPRRSTVASASRSSAEACGVASARRWPACFFSVLTSSRRAATRSAAWCGRDLQRGGDLGELLLLLADVVEGRLAGQGGDPPGPGRDRLLADDLEQADLADVVEVRPAAELARELAHLHHPDDCSGYFSPKSAIAPSALASAIGIVVQVTGSPWRTRALTVSSIARSRSRPTASGLAKSNRSRSGSTLLPACWACLPRCVCSAWCRTCVAECARRIASRRASSTSRDGLRRRR